jgi:hypothetical protein
VLKKLADKARISLNAAQDDPSGEAGAHWSVKQEDTEDELSIFMGRTRFVNTQRAPDPVSTSDSSSSVSPPLAERQGQQAPMRTAPTAGSSYEARRSQPVTLVDVSMDGASGWEGVEATYEEARPPQLYDSQDYDQAHGGRMAPPTSRAPAQGFSWDDTPPPQQQQRRYSDAPRAETSRPRQYSINPSGHHEEQYYDSGPSTIPINQRSQAYYSQPTGYAHPAYGANPGQAGTSSRMGGGSSYIQPSPTSAAPHYHYPTASQDPYGPAQHDGGYGGYQMYPTTPAFHPSGAAPANPALEEMGIVSRDSRLDQRWSSFVSDTGILDGYNGYR